MSGSTTWLKRLKRALGLRPARPAEDSPVVIAARARAIAHAGDQARDAGDWFAAGALYAESLALVPDKVGLRVQLGHALKETGRLTEAEAAYRQAAAASPHDPDILFQLGHLLKVQGRTDAAVRTYLGVLELDPDFVPARNELIDLGARADLPGVRDGRAMAARNLARLSADVERISGTLRDAATVSTFPPEAHDAFRRHFPILPPPTASAAVVSVHVRAETATPAALRATLTSLIDQRHSAWTAVVTAPPALANHPVASLAGIDPRIRFGSPKKTKPSNHAPLLILDAGAVLDPEALGWLLFGLERTGARAIYSDHDHYDADWRGGLSRHTPVLQSMAEPIDLASNPTPPPVLLTTVPAASALEVLAKGPVAHLPRLLVSLPGDATAPTVAVAEPPSSTSGRILVVIPTRDQADMLARAVASLRDRAVARDRLDIRIVDNRSVEAGTARLLRDLAAEGGVVTVHPLDEPFNWSRANNLGAVGDQDIVVFANNDVEMLTDGWDDRLRAWLARDDVGVVGVKLLYPDHTLQHAGILFDAWEGRPAHEGVGAPGKTGGPTNRWRRSRPVAAVTGAFMACRRGTLEATGGFDERLAIAYNDIDFCLRARALALKVVYAADIEAIHAESKTRGRNDTPEKVAWDDAELADMHARWGDWLFHDPGRNPYWAAAFERPYDGLREAPLSRVLVHLDASARPDPWAVTAPVAQKV